MIFEPLLSGEYRVCAFCFFQIQRIYVPHWEVLKPELYNIDSGLPIFLFYNPFGKKDWNILGFPTLKNPGLIKVCTVCRFVDSPLYKTLV